MHPVDQGAPGRTTGTPILTQPLSTRREFRLQTDRTQKGRGRPGVLPERPPLRKPLLKGVSGAQKIAWY